MRHTVKLNQNKSGRIQSAAVNQFGGHGFNPNFNQKSSGMIGTHEHDDPGASTHNGLETITNEDGEIRGADNDIILGDITTKNTPTGRPFTVGFGGIKGGLQNAKSQPHALISH